MKLSTKLMLASYFTMGTLGAFLALAGVTLLSWQFWAILTTVILYGIVENYCGYVRGREE